MGHPEGVSRSRRQSSSGKRGRQWTLGSSYMVSAGLEETDVRFMRYGFKCHLGKTARNNLFFPPVFFFNYSFKNFMSNWRIINSKYCDSIWHTSTWLSSRYIKVPSLLSLPPTSELYLISKRVLVSGVQQSGSVLVSDSFHWKVITWCWVQFPVLRSRSLFVYLIRSSV